jgi:hypothetical protein
MTINGGRAEFTVVCTDDATVIRQLPRRFPLAKQTEGSQLLRNEE